MGIEYVNRRGDKYYLLQGKTKTGKPKYYASRKPQGVPVETMPEGFEIHENPEQGIVSVRKARPTQILPLERESLARWTRNLAGTEHFIIDVDGDSLVIYTPGSDPAETAGRFDRIFGGMMRTTFEKFLAENARYVAMLRFTLTDAKKRLFTAERWCFLGGIDDWHFLASSRPLEEHARKFLPHLIGESFFELI